MLCLLATGFTILLLKVAKGALPKSTDYSWLDRLTPWGWMYDLLHPSGSQMALAIVVMLAFSTVLALLALRHFLKRDL